MDDWLVSLADLNPQQKFIANLKPEESYIVEGCAGSGKSILSMIKFNQLCALGRKPVYATMMRGLTDTIISEVSASKDEGMQKARAYVSNHTKRIECHNVDHGKPWFYSSSCIGTCVRLPCINPDEQYKLIGDNLVVDECQDLSYPDFLKIVNKGKYQSICWYGDDDQQLCDSIGGVAKHVRLQEIFEKCFSGSEQSEKWFKLAWNHRISPNVAKFIDEFQKVIPEVRKPLALCAKGKRTDRPYLCGFQSLEAEVTKVIEIIKNRQWYERNGHKTAIFVGGSNQQVESLYEKVVTAFSRAGLSRADVQRRHGPLVHGGNDWKTADPESAIIVSTPLQSKGCQFDSVFVLANTFGICGKSLGAQELNSIHVAMTRSSGELFVFYTGAMPSAFDQIPVALYETSLTAKPQSADDIGLK